MKNRKSFIIGIKSTKLSTSEINFLNKYKPWGVILFSRNIKNIKQTKILTQSIRNIFKDHKYPILLDQEGGRVNRLNNIIDFSIFTGAFFGKLFKKNKKNFKKYFKIYIQQTSYLLDKIGININTVPILDVRRKKSTNIIGDRSYSNNPMIVSKIGDFCIEEFHKLNIGTVIKHIPGHGSAKVDSHLSTPIINEKLNKLFKVDFLPFKNKKSFFSMTAHIVYADIDKLNTATHSKKIISLIRNKINYKNIIISDDISMKGLKYSIKKNTIKAFRAGCNLVLHCNANNAEMKIVAENSSFLDKFTIKKTSQFYKILR